jgi:hypothetical protein
MNLPLAAELLQLLRRGRSINSAAGQMMMGTMLRLLLVASAAAPLAAQHQPDECDRVLAKACGTARAERAECEKCLEKMESKDDCTPPAKAARSIFRASVTAQAALLARAQVH